MRLIFGICIGFSLWVTGATGQTWSDPNNQSRTPGYDRPKDDGRLDELTKSLNTLLDKGERERLADPWFLKELRELVARYHQPWSRTLLSDDFSARGTKPKQPWRIVSGEYRVDWRYGLRSIVRPTERSAAAAQPDTSSQNQQGDAVQQLFGALLNQALKGAQNRDQNTSGNKTASQVDQRASAEIQAAFPLSNSFSITGDLTVRPFDGADGARFGLGVYQGQKGAGYRLILANNASKGETRLRLIRVNGRGGVSVIDQVQVKFSFDPEDPTPLTWTRGTNGDMTVSIQGQAILQTSDRAFKDPFDGFFIRNRRGDIALRRIQIDGI